MTLEVVNNAIISQGMPHFPVTVTMSVLHHVQDTTTVSQIIGHIGQVNFLLIGNSILANTVSIWYILQGTGYNKGWNGLQNWVSVFDYNNVSLTCTISEILPLV